MLSHLVGSAWRLHQLCGKHQTPLINEVLSSLTAVLEVIEDIKISINNWSINSWSISAGRVFNLALIVKSAKWQIQPASRRKRILISDQFLDIWSLSFHHIGSVQHECYCITETWLILCKRLIQGSKHTGCCTNVHNRHIKKSCTYLSYLRVGKSCKGDTGFVGFILVSFIINENELLLIDSITLWLKQRESALFTIATVLVRSQENFLAISELENIFWKRSLV